MTKHKQHPIVRFLWLTLVWSWLLGGWVASTAIISGEISLRYEFSELVRGVIAMALGMIVVICPFVLFRFFSLISMPLAMSFLVVMSVAFPIWLYFYATARFETPLIYLAFAFYPLAPVVALIFVFSKDTAK